jgi:hypothetical protein
MAEVYDAFDDRLARPVAVKLLRPQLAVQPEVRRRFEAEARVAASISHPNVVAVYDTGEFEGRAYIVMERVKGESLGGWLGRGPLDQTWIHWLAGDILAALAAAHRAGVLHRDIKPGNILITADGRAKVADFGIAKSIEVSAADMTATGLVIGTPAYLAPERLEGRPATPQSDVYAAGMVLYEALTGYRRPMGPDHLANAVALRQLLPHPSVLRPDADPTLVAVLERALAIDPAHRWPSADAMAAALSEPPEAPVTVAFASTSPLTPTTANAGAPGVAAAASPVAAESAFAGGAPLVAVTARSVPAASAVAADPARFAAPTAALSSADSGGTQVLPIIPAPIGRSGRRRPWLLPLVAAVAAVLVATSVSLLVSNSLAAKTPGRSTAPPVQTTNPAPPTTAAPVQAPALPVTTTPTSQANQAGTNQQPAPGKHHGARGGGGQGGGSGGD